VAAAPEAGTCPIPTHITTVPNGEIKAWATHVENGENGSFTVSVTASQDSYLSSAEQSNLAKQCGAILRGTDGGICYCGTGN
jgi:hypothetical protein